MPFVFLVPLVAIGAVVAWALGVPGRRIAVWAGVAVVSLFVLTAASIVVIIGLERGDEAGDAEDGGRSDAAIEAGRLTTRGVDEVVEREVAEEFPAPVDAIDELEDGESRLIRVVVGEPVDLHQCAGVVTRRTCGPGVPAPPGEDAAAVALFEFRQRLRVAGRPIDCRETPCVLVAVAGGEEVVARVPLVFGAEAARARVWVTRRPLSPGDEVTVRVRGLRPGTRGHVTYCVPADAGARCGSPAPEVPFRADEDGDARVALPVFTGAVGGAAGRCGYREACAVGVTGVPVATPYVPVSFAGPAGPDVPAGRTAGGLAVAGGLLAAAVILVRRTDWTPPLGDPFAGVSLAGDPFAGVEIQVPEGW